MSSRGGSGEKASTSARSRVATDAASNPARVPAAVRNRSTPNSSWPRRRSVIPSV
jgi:hypothetical protein